MNYFPYHLKVCALRLIIFQHAGLVADHLDFQTSNRLIRIFQLERSSRCSIDAPAT